MLSLNIQLHSFDLPKSIVDRNDKIRVSITTLPDKQKQAFTFEANKMTVAHPSFTINFSEITEEIVFVFRKNNLFSNDHIIASTYIKSDEFPKLFKNVNNLDIKEMNIYEPIQHLKIKPKCTEERKIIGKMLAQFYLSESFQRQNKPIFKADQQRYPKVDSLLNNGNNENLLFQDLMTN